MLARRMLGVWIILSVVAGLLLPALGTNVASAQTVMAAISDCQESSGQSDCCAGPDMAKACPGCPIMALCALAASLPDIDRATSDIRRYGLQLAFPAGNDIATDGRSAEPPDHPPRSHV